MDRSLEHRDRESWLMRGLISQEHRETSMFPASKELNLRGLRISTRKKGGV